MKNLFKFDSFPEGVFPPEIRKILDRLHEACLFPVEYTAAAILFVVSLLIGRNRRLVTTLGTTYANIYIVLVGVQGSGKSRPVEWATKWLVDRDVAAIQAHQVAVKEWQEAQNEAKKRGEVDDTPSPKCPRYLTNDPTPEALTKLMSDNPAGIGHYSDEFTKLVSDFNRYTQSRNEDFLLSAFTGVPMITDRVTKPMPEAASRVYYSLIGTTQPARLAKLMNGERYTSGLFARCLIVPVFDDSPLLWELEKEPVLDNVNNEYWDFLEALDKDRKSEIEYTLDGDAKVVIQFWQNEKEVSLSVNGKEHERAIFRKIQIYAMKFALLLQITWDISEGKDNPHHVVNGYSALNATKLCDYFFAVSVDMVTTFLAEATLTSKEKELFDKLPIDFTSEAGLQVAQKVGLGKTSFYAFLSKVKGILLSQVTRGHYAKTLSPFEVKFGDDKNTDSTTKSRDRRVFC